MNVSGKCSKSKSIRNDRYFVKDIGKFGSVTVGRFVSISRILKVDVSGIVDEETVIESVSDKELNLCQ